MYKEIYYDYLNDPSFEGTIATCDIVHDLNSYIMEKPLPKRFIPIPITKSSNAFGFMHPNLWNERLQEIIDGLLSGEIINHWLEKFTKSKWALMLNEVENHQIVLNLSHLGFGFQLKILRLNWMLRIYSMMTMNHKYVWKKDAVNWILKSILERKSATKKMKKLM